MAKTLTFAGSDYLPYYKTNSVVIKEKLRKAGVMNLTIDTKGISNAPQEGAEVVYKEDTRFLFGGYITKVSPEEIGKGDLFIFDVEVSDYSIIFGSKIAKRAYANKTLNYIVTDLFGEYLDSGYGFDVTNVDTGPTIETIAFDHISITKCLEKIASITGYVWWVDYEKKLYFTKPELTVNPAPESFTDSSNNYESLKIAYDSTQVRNDVTVIGSPTGVASSSLETQTFTGDGDTTTFILGEFPYLINSITLNGTPQDFSLVSEAKETDDFNYSKDSKNLTKGESGVTPSFGDSLVVTYYPALPVIEEVTDPISITFFQALEGGDGKKEFTIKDTSIGSLEEANARGKQELTEYSMPLADGKVVTRSDMLSGGSIFKTGQLLTLNIPSQGLTTDTVFLIQEVGISVTEDGTNTIYKYTLTFGGKVIGVSEFLEYLAAQQSTGTEASEADNILVIEHLTDSMDFSDSDTAMTGDIETPPYVYGPDGTGPVGRWNLSEWN